MAGDDAEAAEEAKVIQRIDTPADALLYLDYLARFCEEGECVSQMRGIAGVIRSLARRVEEQAMQIERAEAKELCNGG